MADWGKFISTFLPEALDKNKSRTLLFWVFWSATAFMGLLMVLSNPVFGWFMVGVPLLVALLTRRIGLARIPSILLVVAGIALVFPAFFVGLAQQGDDPVTGLPLVAMIMFIVWVTTYPTLLRVLNEQYLEQEFPGEDVRDDVALVRKTMIALWMATITLQVLGDALGALVCLVALWHRRHWSAWIAALVCLISPLLKYKFGQLQLDLEWLTLVGAVCAAKPWYEATKLPLWDKRHGVYH